MHEAPERAHSSRLPGVEHREGVGEDMGHRMHAGNSEHIPREEGEGEVGAASCGQADSMRTPAGYHGDYLQLQQAHAVGGGNAASGALCVPGQSRLEHKREGDTCRCYKVVKTDALSPTTLCASIAMHWEQRGLCCAVGPETCGALDQPCCLPAPITGTCWGSVTTHAWNTLRERVSVQGIQSGWCVLVQLRAVPMDTQAWCGTRVDMR